MAEGDSACRRCEQKNIDCVRRPDMHAVLEEREQWRHAQMENERWRAGMEREMHALRHTLEQLQERLESEEPPAKRRAVREMASEGLLRLAQPEAHAPRASSSPVPLSDGTAAYGSEDADGGGPSSFLRNPGSAVPSRARLAAARDPLVPEIVSEEEVVRLFYFFFRELDPHLCGLVAPVHGLNLEEGSAALGSLQAPATRCKVVEAVESVRSSSQLLYVAIMCVASLHMRRRTVHGTDAEPLFPELYRTYIRLAAMQAFSRHQALDDIRALVIGAFWLKDVSWTLVGTAVRVATERLLHERYRQWVPSEPLLRKRRMHDTSSDGPSPEDRAAARSRNAPHDRAAYEESRLYYLIYIADHQASIPYGRPPMTRQHAVVRHSVEWLNHCPFAENRADTRLIAQVKLWEILHDAIDEIGTDLHAPLDEYGLALHARLQHEIQLWSQRWLWQFSALDAFERTEIERQACFAQLFLDSMAFRTDAGSIPCLFPRQVYQRTLGESKLAVEQALFQAHKRRAVAENAIDSAHRVLRLLGGDVPKAVNMLIGSTSYAHTMTTFAIVLLVKALKYFGGEGGDEAAGLLHGADLPTVLASVDPTMRSLAAASKFVAPEHILVSITAGTQSAVEQIRTAFSSLEEPADPPGGPAGPAAWEPPHVWPDGPAECSAERSAERPAEHAAQRFADRSAERFPEHGTDHAADHAADRPADRFVDRFAGRAPERTWPVTPSTLLAPHAVSGAPAASTPAPRESAQNDSIAPMLESLGNYDLLSGQIPFSGVDDWQTNGATLPDMSTIFA